MKYKILSKKIVYETKKFQLIRDRIKRGDYERNSTYITTYQEGVCIVPYLEDIDSFLLVNQYRHPVGKSIWQFPAGGRENNETYMQCANRELEEETGYIADNLIGLGNYNPDVELISNKSMFFLALSPKISKGNKFKSAEEDVTCTIVTQSALKEKIKSSEIMDSSTLVGYLLFSLWQESHHTNSNT